MKRKLRPGRILRNTKGEKCFEVVTDTNDNGMGLITYVVKILKGTHTGWTTDLQIHINSPDDFSERFC